MSSPTSPILLGQPHFYSIDPTKCQLHGIYNSDHNVHLEAFFVNESEDKACGKHLPLTAITHIETPITPPRTPPRARAPRVRPLITTMPRIDTMLERTPDSPPDLTDSKSSSFYSSSLGDLGSNGIPDFEDISLDELRILPSQSSPKRPPVRTSLTSTSSSRSSGQGLSSFRDLTNSKPRYPSLRTQVNGAVRQQACLDPPVKTTRRGSSSPSRPRNPPAPRSRSISPSDASQHKLPPSPCSLRSNSRSGSSPLMMPPGRRPSWQPGRKTVKELEEEYHDSDEEVPEDAIMWNVPMSPRPPHERSAPQTPAACSPRVSVSGEGDQGPVKHHASAPGVFPRSANASPQRSHLPTRPPLPVSASESSVTDGLHPYRPRTKSWTAALYDLSPEARNLTEALEAYAEQAERQHEEKIQNGSSAVRRQSHDTNKNRSTTSLIELPPLQKGNIMIDPLPISKEKEKVLARTRPSWLPPKDPKEEKKHLKEYQRMMAYSLEAEKRKAAQLTEAKAARDSTAASLSRLWDQHVLPNWDAAIADPRTRELWWRGVPPSSRGTVWARAIGNELGLSEASYVVALGRAKDLMHKLSELPDEERVKRKESKWFSNIQQDCLHTFPELNIFQPSGPLHQPFLDLLAAYATYRPDVGYVSGTHAVAALLLLNLPSGAPAFVALANLLNRGVPLAFLTADEAAQRRTCAVFKGAVRYKLPKLATHLLGPDSRPSSRSGGDASPSSGHREGKTEHGAVLSPEEYLTPLFKSLFAAHLDTQTASRLWDVYVFEGDRALVRAAVGVLAALEGKLYGSREEVLETLEGGWEVGGEEEFMRGMRGAGKVEGKGSG